ncbi:uncharacterized protein LOC108205993 isoform X2 [Daucus carota subsp. sativus]|uniref:uncharacterized protein LOC108205993 isoform X2 n=1 Tax=Daucus carota subsp. sativus TaxID=79200 RepID=UPI0007EF6FD4|nr:PREDICTED: uncharacterized protein LOC108205993 [Daucus carota subsp. sativus]
MGFFDLNIPYSDSTNSTTRLKLIVKAMELGYTGIAYNRSIKGVMSESHRCSISLFPLSSLLKRLSPPSVEFHRSLLGVPKATPFRQYTRLTVLVDSSVQAAALNSGNPVLKTYDIVAVKPLNQMAFEQACRTCQVDLIAIDFSDKLPFRLKQPLVKAAIERGVYFEITYSSLIMDAQARRQFISNAKLLVDWTKGTYLIFSSAAPSITELRGPYDVANLMTLLGITMERAKAAISKNCRSLVADIIRKKKFYKEAIKVELVTKDPEFDEWLEWDPISSGEGDLLLDEMAKLFNASSKESNKVKAIDFVSVMDSLPANGLQIKDIMPITKPELEPFSGSNLPSSVKKTLELVDDPRAPNSDQSFDSTNFKKVSDESLKGSIKVSSVLDAATSNHGHDLNSLQFQTSTSTCETLVASHIDTLEGYDMQTEKDMATCQNKLQIDTLEGHDVQPESAMLTSQTKCPGEAVTVNTLSREEVIAKNCSALADTQTSTMLVDHNLPSHQGEQCKQLSCLNIVSCPQDVVMDEILNEEDIKVNAGDTVETLTVSKDYGSDCASKAYLPLNNTDAVLATTDETSLDTYMTYKPELCSVSDLSLHENRMIEQVKKTGAGDEASILGESSVLESHDLSPATNNPTADTPMEEQKQIENQYVTEQHVLNSSKIGTRRKKRKTPRSAGLFPFRRLWNPIQFKKSARTIKRKIVTR